MAKLTPAQMKKAVEEFKKQFTGGFLHGSPSPNIKAFDPSKGDRAFPTEGVTFVTRDKDFADSFLGMNRKGEYEKGSTIYPVNVNLGKHFVPGSKEGSALIDQFAASLPDNPDAKLSAAKKAALLKSGAWDVMEDPNFLQYLRDTGHDTFTVMEGGVPNVGIFEPKNIRGKFAKFNPEDAESADFMKAEGGSVEGYAGGGKVGALTELMKHVEQQMGRRAAQRVEKAADLIPNLEHKYDAKALRGTFAGDNNRPLVIMPPSKFENFAQPMWPEHKRASDFPVGDRNDATYQEYLEYLKTLTQPGVGGFRDVPKLHIGKPNEMPQITGHEGRHRSAALAQMGDEPSLVRLLPEWELDQNLPRHKMIGDYLDAWNENIGASPIVRPEISEMYGIRPNVQLPEVFAAGGNVVKKVLQHAKSVPFVHYSQSPNISTLDPNMYGRGIKGAEAARLKDAPDIKPRSYFYTQAGGRQPEQGLGPHKYQGVAEDIYPLHDDPAGYSAIAREKAIDPYMMQFGREMVDEKAHLNELERLIKGAGYRGYANDDVGLLFDPTPVIKAE